MSLTALRAAPGWNRARLTVVLSVPALLVVGIVALAAGLYLATLAGPDSTRSGFARIGDALALVIVTGGTVEETATFVTRWFLLVPTVILIPAVGLAWVVAGRVTRLTDEARAEIGAADDERRSRLQEVVHELRTPLAVMSTNLELAGAGLGTDTEPAGFIEASRRAVDRMARTVDDLEGHGRLAVSHDGGPVELADLAQAAVVEHVGPARSRAIALRLARNDPVTVPAADFAAVRTALGNFLSNSVRLSPQGSTVTLDWGVVDRWAWIAVIDEGPGLPSHLHARVFERGWRGPHDRDRDPGIEGGLGLTIARQVTEAQGGLVTIDSEEGRGSVFALWLPLDHGADQGVVTVDGIHPLARPWLDSLQSA